MARLGQVVIPGVPHHITQRGNRRQQTFFQEDDYAAYLDLMAEWCTQEGVGISGGGGLRRLSWTNRTCWERHGM